MTDDEERREFARELMNDCTKVKCMSYDCDNMVRYDDESEAVRMLAARDARLLADSGPAAKVRELVEELRRLSGSRSPAELAYADVVSRLRALLPEPATPTDPETT